MAVKAAPTVGRIGSNTLRQMTRDLAATVRRHAAALPAAERFWLAEPLTDAAALAVAPAADAVTVEVAVHEVQTWALIAARHGHWSARVADDVDRRCEAILDRLHAASAQLPARRRAA